MKRTIVPRGMLTLSLAVVLTRDGNLPNTASKKIKLVKRR